MYFTSNLNSWRICAYFCNFQLEVELEVFMELREVITLQLFRRLSHCPHESRLTSQGSMTRPDHPSALWLKFFLTRKSFVAGHLGRNTHFPSPPLCSTGTSPSPCSGTSVVMPFCHCQEPTCGLWKAGSYLMEEPLALGIPNYFIWFFFRANKSVSEIYLAAFSSSHPHCPDADHHCLTLWWLDPCPGLRLLLLVLMQPPTCFSMQQPQWFWKNAD